MRGSAQGDARTRRAERSNASRGPVGASEAAWRGRRSHRPSFPLPHFLRPRAPLHPLCAPRCFAAQFARYALKNPSILYPALHVQEVLREIICGKAFWLAATERRAGKAEVQQVVDFCDTIKLEVRQQNLLQAIVGMMDGLVVAEDLAPTGDVERIRDVWSKTFGVGKRSLMLGRGESLKALNDARGGKPKKNLASIVRGMSSKLLAVNGFKPPKGKKAAVAPATR